MISLQSLFDKAFMKMVKHAHDKFKEIQDTSTLYDTMQSISQIAVQLNHASKSKEKTIFSPEKMKLLQDGVSDLLYDIEQSLRFSHDANLMKDLYSRRHDIEYAFKEMKELITIV